ncbi:MAG: hypothetical protein GY845_26705 [Planctomycetes bacterium]|nr:hypothetical protein [Planctomycetota bacterium]
MFDGLWVIEFKSDYDFGYGVLVFNGNQVLGGDFGYYYSGRINTTGNMTGEVNVVRHNPNAVSVFGDVDSFTLLIKDGTISNKSFKLNATIKGVEHLTIEVSGKKKVDTDETH